MLGSSEEEMYDRSIHDKFRLNLVKFKDYLQKRHRLVPFPTLFVSYAWPRKTEDDKGVCCYSKTERRQEEWVEDLVGDLQEAGFEILYDKDENMAQGTAAQFTKKIEEANTRTVFIGTPLYMQKVKRREEGFYHVVQTELALIEKRFKEHPYSVIPILLSGTSGEALPDFLTEKNKPEAEKQRYIFSDMRPFLHKRCPKVKEMTEKEEKEVVERRDYYKVFFDMLKAIYKNAMDLKEEQIGQIRDKLADVERVFRAEYNKAQLLRQKQEECFEKIQREIQKELNQKYGMRRRAALQLRKSLKSPFEQVKEYTGKLKTYLEKRKPEKIKETVESLDAVLLWQYPLDITRELWGSIEILEERQFSLAIQNMVRGIYRKYAEITLMKSMEIGQGFKKAIKDKWQAVFAKLESPEKLVNRDCKEEEASCLLERQHAYTVTRLLGKMKKSEKTIIEKIKNVQEEGFNEGKIREIRELTEEQNEENVKMFFRQWLFESILETMLGEMENREAILNEMKQAMDEGEFDKQSPADQERFWEDSERKTLLIEKTKRAARAGLALELMIEEAVQRKELCPAKEMLRLLGEKSVDETQRELAETVKTELGAIMESGEEYKEPFWVEPAKKLYVYYRDEKKEVAPAFQYCKKVVAVKKQKGIAVSIEEYEELTDAVSKTASGIVRQITYREVIQALTVLKTEVSEAELESCNCLLAKAEIFQGKLELAKEERVKAAQSFKRGLLYYPEKEKSDELRIMAEEGLHKAVFEGFHKPLTEAIEGVSRPADEKEEKDAVYIKGVYSGTRILNPEEEEKLFDGDRIRRANRYGRRNVAVIGSGEKRIHIKENPGCPGLEYAAGTLFHMMAGGGITPTELMRIERDGRFYAVQASKTVEGQTLKEIMAEKTESQLAELFRKLNKRHYSAMVLMSMLIDPEDWGLTNLILRENKNTNEYEIVGIDNDHIFVKEEVAKKKANVKNALFCFDQMRESIDEEVSSLFLSDAFNPIEIIRIWILELQGYNRKAFELFDEEARSQIYDKRKEDKRIIVQTFMPEGLTGRMYAKYLIMRRELGMDKDITHLELLERTHMGLGRIYKKLFAEKNGLKTVESRFRKVSAGSYQKGVTTTTSTIMVRKVLGRMPQRKELDGSKYQPLCMLKELDEFSYDNKFFEIVKAEFMSSNWRSFKDLSTILKERVLKATDFARLMNYSQERHEELIKILAGERFRRLIIKNNARLQTSELGKIVRECPELVELDVSGCKALSTIGYGFLYQTRIFDDLAKCELLESLDIRGCPELTNIPLSRNPRLKNINVININEAYYEALMGGNYFGIRDHFRIFGEIPQEIPPLPEGMGKTLQSQCPFKKGANMIFQTHLLFLMPRLVKGRELTIMRWWELEKEHQSSHKDKLIYHWDWYKTEAFANTPIESTQWMLMPKEMVPNSTNKTWQEQLTELQKYPGYEVPNALSVVSGVLLHYLKTGEKLYGDRYKIDYYMPYVRTFDTASFGRRVLIGYFDADGLYVHYIYDDNQISYLGLAAWRQ